jgi:hypothetical protein
MPAKTAIGLPYVDAWGRRYSVKVASWPPAARRALGIRMVPAATIDSAEIWKLWKAGQSVRQVARATGIAKSTVHQMVHRIARDGGFAPAPDEAPDTPPITDVDTISEELARFIRRSLGCDSKDGDEAVGFA